jgi:uncharacterized protein
VVTHLEKKGIRMFAIAESFVQSELRSVLAGVVIRRDLIIDGLIFDSVTIKGTDSTQTILSMYRNIDRNDINCILLGGTIISILNIVDGQKLQNILQVPVIAVTSIERKGLNKHNLLRFENGHSRLQLYDALPERAELKLWTGKAVHVRNWGITESEALSLLNDITLQGSRPEPIRIANLAARAYRISCKPKSNL